MVGGRRGVGLLVVCSGVVLSWPAVAVARAPASAARVSRAVVRLARSTVHRHALLPGVIMDVEAPRLGLSRSFAVGSLAVPRGRRARAGAVFRYASNTKTCVAAATMRLVEQHRLGLGDRIAARLPSELAAIVPGADQITVDMLLHHTSGLPDYASDPRYAAQVLSDLHHHWTRLEQVQWALAHNAPYGPPGTVFRYSDTGYILLGAIIEQTTGRSLSDALPALLRFRRLGLATTWLEDGRPAPRDGGLRQHQYVGQVDLTAADPSFDLYGGGGLIGTARDLARFWQALFAGRVISPRSLARLERVPPGADGAAGLFPTQFGRHRVWFHEGFFGTLALAVPSLHLQIALSTGQADTIDDGTVDRLGADVVRILARAQQHKNSR